VVDHGAIAHVQIEQSLDAVVLLVDEVDLVLQLLHVAFIGLLLVFLGKLVDVLTTLVKFAEAQDLRVTHLDRTVEVGQFFLKGEMRLHQVFVLVAQFIRALISMTQLLGPLVVFDRHATVLVLLWVSRTLIAFTIHITIVNADTARPQILTQREALSGATKHIVQLAVAVEPANDLILRWHVEFLHHAVQFLTQFHVLAVQGSHLRIFLSQQEFDILDFIGGLAALCFPFKIGTIGMLSVLN